MNTANDDIPLRICFDPNSTSSLNPIQIDYCYSSPRELLTSIWSPVLEDYYTVSRGSYYMLCVPEDICDATLRIYSVGVDQETGDEVNSNLIAELLNPTTEDNRLTVCMDCPSGYKIVLPVHRDILTTIGTYRMDLTYSCCDGEGRLGDDNIVSNGSVSFYYEFVNTASNADVEIAFTASQEIENFNGDPDIDGILSTDGSFPGPALGPSSAGVRVSMVGNGIIDYSVDVYEVDCNDPTSENIINSETLPYNGDQQVFYSFLNIPNWENIYDPNACYKVVTQVNSVCGSYSEEAYFTITDHCTFCLINNEEKEMTTISEKPVKVHINGRNQIEVNSEASLHSIVVLDEFGRVIERKNLENSKNGLILVNKRSATYSRYFLIITIDKEGNVQKSMIPNLR